VHESLLKAKWQMASNWIGNVKLGSAVWPAAFLGVTAAGGVWLWLARADTAYALRVSPVFAITATLGCVGVSRARTTTRWRGALDAYAEREIARANRQKAGSALTILKKPARARKSPAGGRSSAFRSS